MDDLGWIVSRWPGMCSPEYIAEYIATDGTRSVWTPYADRAKVFRSKKHAQKLADRLRQNRPTGAKLNVLNLTPKTGSGVDLSQVVSAVFVVKDPHGNNHEWAAEIAIQSTSTLQLRHTLVAGELGLKGIYSIYAKMAMVGGGYKCSDPLEEPVKDEFEV